MVATAAAQAVERVGMPESQIILSQAVAYMACAPKSNAAVNAIFAAMNSVKRTKTTVPVHLQDAHYGGHEKLGHGIGYKYAHDYPNHYVQQQYLPDEIKDEKFYELSDMGYEKKLKEHMEFIRRNKAVEVVIKWRSFTEAPPLFLHIFLRISSAIAYTLPWLP